MKRAVAAVGAGILAVAAGLFLLGGASQPAGLTQAERDKLVGHLEKIQKELEAEVRGLSDAQWNFKPAPERWSVAEVCEHIAASEDLLFGLVTEQILKSPPDPSKKSAAAGKDDEVLKRLVDRSQKAQAPEQLQPVNRYGSPEDTLQRFAQSRRRTIEFVRTTDADLRSHFEENPVLGTLDAYQWLLFLSAHTERHLLQLQEVKADPGFPKKM